MTGLLLWVIGAAGAGDQEADPREAERREAERREEAGDWPGALAAWQRCAQGGQAGADQRHCRRQAERLAPQAADGFAGWAELEAVRRSYAQLGSDEALARIRAALEAHPESPARGGMERWLANEYARRGERGALREIAAARPEDAFVGMLLADQAAQERERGLQALAAGLLLLCAAVAAARPGSLAWGSAAAAGLVLGLAPLGLAWIYEPVWWRGFAAVGAVIPALVWAGRRVPAWLTVPALWAVIAAAGVTEGWW